MIYGLGQVLEEITPEELAVPRILDVLVHKFRMMYFINQRHLVIVDDDHFAVRIIDRIRRKRVRQGQTKEKFLSIFGILQSFYKQLTAGR